MIVTAYRPSAQSLAIAEAVAKAIGSRFDRARSAADGEKILRLYFEDVQRALSPEYDGVRYGDFTRRAINASASLYDAEHPYVHIDQQFDIWLLTAGTLCAVRALHALGAENTSAWNTIFARVLDSRADISLQDEVRRDMLHIFLQYGEALRLAHPLTTASYVFVACHELSHIGLGHVAHKQIAEYEFEADAAGYCLMRRVFAPTAQLQTLTPRPYVMAGAWFVLKLFDLSERRLAQRSGQRARIASITHPSAQDRLARIAPLLADEREPSVAKFIDGFGLAMDAASRDLGLDAIG